MKITRELSSSSSSSSSMLIMPEGSQINNRFTNEGIHERTTTMKQKIARKVVLFGSTARLRHARARCI